MAKNLMESYKGRLAISEKLYVDRNGAKMPAERKLVVAQCLDNVAKFMNESFNTSVGTQRSDLGTFKRFCLDITTLTTPNLIVNDIFMVKPMSSFTGYLSYMEFALGTAKGGVGQETVIQNPFVYGAMTEDRMRYSGEAVVEKVEAGKNAVAFLPVVGNKVEFIPESGARVELEVVNGEIEAPAAGKIAYKYDNQIIPQEKLPTLVGRMNGVTLAARARRLAVKYSQFAAYQSKQDYGIDFESTIAQQAQAELAYQTDSEAVFLVKDAADRACTKEKGTLVNWIDEELDTISYSMKAEGFLRKIQEVKMAVFKRNNRHVPNWMIVSPEMMPILSFVPGFKAASANIAQGPYIAGDVEGLKVIVHPSLAGAKVCYLGVLGNDGVTGVGVYAPYMPIVPTQLLGFADGTMEQGFSSMYDMKILNEELLGKILVEDGDDAALFKQI